MPRLPAFANPSSLGVALVLAAQIAGAGFGFLLSIVLARLIGASGTGLYFLCLMIVDVCATLARLGLDQAALRFAAIAHHAGDRKQLAAIYRMAVGIVAAAALVVALAAWAIVPELARAGLLAGELGGLFPLLVLAVVPAALVTVQAECFRATGAPGLAALFQNLLPPLLLVCSTLMLGAFGPVIAYDVIGLYVAIANGVLISAGLLWALRVPGVWRLPGQFDAGLLLRSGLPLLAAMGLNLLMAWTDIFVLGLFADTTTVGIYGVALRISTLTAFVLIAVNSVVAPEFARLHADGRHEALARLAQKSAFWTLAVALPPLLLMIVVPETILAMFGEPFAAAAWPLRILALGQLANVATGQVASLLTMTGHGKLFRNAVAVAAAMNVAGNFLLVPPFGALGAAASTAFCLATMNLAGCWFVHRRLGFNILRYRSGLALH